MLSGQQLIDDIDQAEVHWGEYAFWWLGQHSFIVKLGKKILYLDVFLSPLPNRRGLPMLKPEEIRHADFFFGSHDHADHIDREVWPALAHASPNTKFVVPELLRVSLSKDLAISINSFIGLDDNKTIEVDGIKITGIAAAHEFLDRDQATGRYPYLGYVIEGNGCTLYHSGDCCIYEGLVTKLKRWNFDVIFLPINGRDARRFSQNCIGNMTYQEAADLAGVLVPKLTIPAHYDMFAMNAEDPNLFVDYMHVKYPALNVFQCDYGKKYVGMVENLSR